MNLKVTMSIAFQEKTDLNNESIFIGHFSNTKYLFEKTD